LRFLIVFILSLENYSRRAFSHLSPKYIIPRPAHLFMPLFYYELEK
jgi:hypothetical protein